MGEEEKRGEELEWGVLRDSSGGGGAEGRGGGGGMRAMQEEESAVGAVKMRT